jgi:long-chain fatty acid transport protein
VTHKEFNIARTSLALAAALALSQGALASGYNFGTQSAAAQGTANANGAEANDATTIYSNPAGMSRLKGTQVSQVLDLVLPTVEFTQTGTATGKSSASAGQLLGAPTAITGSNGGDPVHSTFVPHGYLTHEINSQWVAGVGVFVPFGAKIEYSDDFVGRYYGQKTDMKTININPSVSYKLNEQHSFGFGLDFQYMKAKLQRKVKYSPLPDFTFNVEGDSWGYGYNLGYLFQPSTQTRFGVAYRSAISQDNKGTADVHDSNGTLLKHSDIAQAKLKTPESLSVNGYHELNDKWAVMGDITWTRHSHLDQIVIDAQPVTTTYLQTKWKDTFKYSIGGTYRLNQDIKLRAGYMFDQSPTQDAADVLTTLPDNDRQWLSVGANWKLGANDSLDFAYSYILIRDRDVNRSYDSQTNVDRPSGTPVPNYPSYPGTGTTYGNVQGVFRSHAQIIGVQWNHAF